MYSEATIFACGFEVTEDTFKTAKWEKTIGSSISKRYCNAIEVGVLNEQVIKQCSKCVVVTREFGSKASIEKKMIEFMYSTFKG